MGGATMKVQALGHAVLKVRNLERSEQFYNGVLGIPIAARHETMPMTFFTLGNHHDLAILAVGDDAPDAPRNAPGLYHIALKVGDSLDELREVKQHLERDDRPHGVAVALPARPGRQRRRALHRRLRYLEGRPAAGGTRRAAGDLGIRCETSGIRSPIHLTPHT
jgi:catechol 2,3-dioxygenase-like lactoylglutathione lyase family enzyme